MVTIEGCMAFSGLAWDEIVLGATPSNTHRILLSSYLLNLWRGPNAVRKMIVADMRLSLDLGMIKHAADLLLVLRRFLSDYPSPDWRIGRAKARTETSSHSLTGMSNDEIRNAPLG